MDIEELRKAAERMRRWDAGERPSTIYTQGSDVIGAADNDAWDLARWAVAELSRRDAEQAERERPIDEEWLRSLGFIPEHDLAWHFGRVSVRQYAQCVGDDVESTILLDDNEILWRATRGQLIDLLAALKGGAK